ncbi:MAG: translation initiation factor IF-3 [Candidatus Omnitrophica bacterium]|nr:translation initiation factor IF-3 [Candidatus Omnitrophota bacterium]
MVAIKKFIRVNERIRVSHVRLIGPDAQQLGIVAIQKALELANQYDLDLVEVAPTANPPVCRIIDFSKFKYDEEKKEREAKKHQKQGKLKEIRLKPNIDDHDYETKLKHVISFLKKKDKVKINLFFRGRQMEHIDLGKKVLDRFIADLANDGQLEKKTALEGRIMYFVVAPK